jgi:heat shock protein HslJ
MAARIPAVMAAALLSLLLPAGAALAQDASIQRLYGENWHRVLELQGPVLRAPQDIDQTLGFRDNGTLAGSTGCNGYGGAVDLSGGKVKLGPMRMSRRACSPPVMDAEQDFMARLQAARQWWVRDGELYMTDGNGSPLLRFQR